VDLGVVPYCLCKPGFTGLQCGDQVTTCSQTQCAGREHTSCTNDGDCVCAPGYIGDRCNVTDAHACSVTIEIKCTAGANALNADQVRAILAALIKIDISNINVTGPVHSGDNEVKYTFSLCSSSGDLNTQLAAASFYASIGAGNDGGLNVVNGATTANSNDAKSLVVYSALMTAVVFSLL